MPKLITKEMFIQTIENNEIGLTNEELATTLGISLSYFYDLRKKYQDEIRDLAKEMAKKTAVTQISNLKRNASKGDTRAAQLLLVIGEAYTPRNNLDMTGKLTINYNIGGVKVPKNAGTGVNDTDIVNKHSELVNVGNE